MIDKQVLTPAGKLTALFDADARCTRLGRRTHIAIATLTLGHALVHASDVHLTAADTLARSAALAKHLVRHTTTPLLDDARGRHGIVSIGQRQRHRAHKHRQQVDDVIHFAGILDDANEWFENENFENSKARATKLA